VEAENEKLTAVLLKIADMPSGAIPGHAVAVGCGHNIVAWKAVHAPTEVQCEACDGDGYTMDYGPWKTTGVPNSRDYVITSERAEKGDPNCIVYGQRAPCRVCDESGWLDTPDPERAREVDDG
jgi:hypothetical protein